MSTNLVFSVQSLASTTSVQKMPFIYGYPHRKRPKEKKNEKSENSEKIIKHNIDYIYYNYRYHESYMVLSTNLVNDHSN